MGVHVMDGAGFYNRHSVQQHEAAAAGVEVLRRAAERCEPAGGDAPLVLADLGASQGRNSVHPLAVAIGVLRGRVGDSRPVAVVHTDLPENDFASLFEVVAHDPASYRADGVFTFVVGRSFYEQVFPPGTVTLGWSATAAVWLSAVPCPLPDHLFSFASTGAERETWKRAADADWRTFLRRRATELRSGAELVVSLPVAGPGYLPWMELVEAGAARAREAGAITAAEHAAMVVPTYLSDPADLRAAVADTPSLRVEEDLVTVAPDPAYDAFREHHDAHRYAREAVDLFRAWSEPSLMSGLDPSRDAAARREAADEFFGHIRDQLADAPTECPWSIGLLRIRRTEDRARSR